MEERIDLKQQITKKQLTAIRFYMGDPEIVKNGPYLGGPKAYNTINALLHRGTQDEEEKIRDQKPIEIFDADHLKGYLDLIKDIKEAMETYRDNHQNDSLQNRVTYRIDRVSAVERLKEAPYIYGYFSTCKWGFLEEYAHTKSDIVLLEVHRDADVPYLDFSELFQDFYAKPEEAEVLLIHGALIDRLEEIPLSEEEMTHYCDMNGSPPRGKWRLWVRCAKSRVIEEESKQDMYQFIINEQHVTRVRTCMSLLSAKKELSVEDRAFYCEWKEKILKFFQKL